MFCPQCGVSQSDDLKFCKSCGVNLVAVRQAAALSDAHPKFDWSKTWVAEMLLSEGERKRRGEEVERQRGITPEIKRYKEVKAGVMTSSVGVGVMIFLFVLTNGIIAAGVPPEAAHILSVVWAAGMIPFFVGVGLMINGLVVGKKMVEVRRRQLQPREASLLDSPKSGIQSLSRASSDWPEPVSSVTENTTRQLEGSRKTE